MDSIKEGLLGLILFFSQWLAPHNDTASLSALPMHSSDSGRIVVRLNLEPAWNQQMEQLVDAGIPLRFRIASSHDKSDTAVFYRTLLCDVSRYTYSIIDSSHGGIRRSRQYPMVLLALRDFCRWEDTIPAPSVRFWAEASILPSLAAQLDRYVDMSRVWGRKRVFCEIRPAEMLAKRGRNP